MAGISRTVSIEENNKTDLILGNSDLIDWRLLRAMNGFKRRAKSVFQLDAADKSLIQFTI